MAHSKPPMVSAFVAELARRLQGRGPALAMPLTWVEQHLAESGMTIAQMVQSENQLQAADQVSISNSIGSLRVLGARDWQTFVESQSIVEQTLQGDPEKNLRGHGFRHPRPVPPCHRNNARRAKVPEGDVARKAVELSSNASLAGDGGAMGHVGFYLIGQGLPSLESALGIFQSFPESVSRTARRFPLPIYLGGIAVISASCLQASSTACSSSGCRNGQSFRSP